MTPGYAELALTLACPSCGANFPALLGCSPADTDEAAAWQFLDDSPQYELVECPDTCPACSYLFTAADWDTFYRRAIDHAELVRLDTEDNQHD